MNLFFCLWIEVSIRKKMTGNCIIARSAWCKVSVIFFRMGTSSRNKTNKFIPYHLIISKTKYCRIKRYIFHDLFMHYILCDVWVFYDVWVLRHRSMDSKIHLIFQPLEKLVTWEIKWFKKQTKKFHTKPCKICVHVPSFLT